MISLQEIINNTPVSFFPSNKEKMGRAGELIVSSILTDKSFTVELSSYKYDSTGDMTVNGKKIEVKTQNRHLGRNEFSISSIGQKNIKKCLNVDLLVFVEYSPHSMNHIINVYNCLKRDYNLFSVRNGSQRIGFPVQNMELIYSFKDKEISDYMRSLSNSQDIH